MVTRRCLLCGKEKPVRAFYFRRRSRRYETICHRCRNTGALSGHTHDWKRVEVYQAGSSWRWKFRCMICATTNHFSTEYAPASQDLPQTNDQKKAARLPLQGQVVVLTGVMSVSREEVTERLQAAGAHVAVTLRRDSTLLLVGTHPSGKKLARAKELNVRLTDELSIASLLGKQSWGVSSAAVVRRRQAAQDRLKKWARYVLSYAVRLGLVTRASACEECGAVGKTDGHHANYHEPLNVAWLCRKCRSDADDARASAPPSLGNIAALRTLLRGAQAAGQSYEVAGQLVDFR